MKKYKERIWKELEEFCRLCDPSTKYMETCDQCEKRWYVNRLAEAREEIESYKMKTININKVIKEIEYVIIGCTDSDKGIGARWGLDYAIQIIKNNIQEDDRESYEQLDHYCDQWQERHGNILDKYLKLSDRYFDLLEKYKNNEKTN